jgi:FSR family fosmidomycin resistance protein-like MFS transporter
MGLSLSLGGVLTPAIGWIADRNGLVTALLLLAAVPVAGAVVALTLPEPRLRGRRSA